MTFIIPELNGATASPSEDCYESQFNFNNSVIIDSSNFSSSSDSDDLTSFQKPIDPQEIAKTREFILSKLGDSEKRKRVALEASRKRNSLRCARKLKHPLFINSSSEDEDEDLNSTDY